jgi:D-psicose/D-tagatose/L-ribulose 3-epimerase
MKIGINTFIWSAQFTEAQVPLLAGIKAAGFDGIECAIFDPAAFEAKLLRSALSAHGLELTCCGVIPQGMSLIDEDDAIRRKGLDYMKSAIAAAAEAGAGILAGPYYSPVGYLPGRRRTAAEWGHAVESLQALGPVLDAHDVTLAVEPLNRFETYFLNLADDAAALAEAVGHPRVGILFDTFHANIEEKNIADGYRRVGPWLKHVHTCENDRGTPGSGHVEWPAVFEALREVGYDGWLTIESFSSQVPEIAAAASVWRDFASPIESIAFDGVRFLRSMTSTMANR